MIVVINCPFTIDYERDLFIKYKILIKNLKKISNVSVYNVKFSLALKKKLNFTLDDLKFESVAQDIFDIYGKQKIFLIGIECGSPLALYYSYHYSKYCSGVITFPLRKATKEKLDRRIHKFKENKGWEKHVSTKYNVDDYFINLNNKRLQELLLKQKEKEEQLIIFLSVDLNLRKQYQKIPEICKVPTVIYIRLDLNAQAFIERNLKTAAIADMKKLTNEHDTMVYSCVVSIEMVAEIDKVVNKNLKNNNLLVQYLPHMDNKKYDYGNYIVNSVKSLLY
jgi:hypothetical protein